MSYTKIDIEATTPITPSLLRHLESQYDQAIVDIGAKPRADTTLALIAEQKATAPVGRTGRIYFNTTDGKMYLYDGDDWREC